MTFEICAHELMYLSPILSQWRLFKWTENIRVVSRAILATWCPGIYNPTEVAAENRIPPLSFKLL